MLKNNAKKIEYANSELLISLRKDSMSFKLISSASVDFLFSFMVSLDNSNGFLIPVGRVTDTTPERAIG
jgi:hypothetical protein